MGKPRRANDFEMYDVTIRHYDGSDSTHTVRNDDIKNNIVAEQHQEVAIIVDFWSDTTKIIHGTVVDVQKVDK